MILNCYINCTVICTTHDECLLSRMKLKVFKGAVFENNARVAELSVSTYLSRWADRRSEIGAVRNLVPYGSSVWIAKLKDTS